MRRRSPLRLAAAFGLALGLIPPPPSGAVAVDGVDRARVLIPPGAAVNDVAQPGYLLVRRGQEATIEVDASPLESRAPYAPPSRRDGGAVERLGRALAAGSATQYEASSRILAWVARHVRYDLDRAAPQTATAVLARRSGYCTGVARLTAGLLVAAGLEAREVPGWVARTDPGQPAGFHRWIEVRLADRGWVMSDPLRSHHFVPATYVRLGSERLEVEAGLDGLLLARDDRVEPVDVFAFDGGVPARRNDGRQRAGALKVIARGWSGTTAILEGEGSRRTRDLRDGATTFVGLEPGRYLVRLPAAHGPTLVGEIELADRLRTAIHLTLPPAPSRAEPIGSPE